MAQRQDYEVAREELATLLDKAYITATIRGGEEATDAEKWAHRLWNVRVKLDGLDILRTTYRTGMGITEIPTREDVVGSLLSDAGYAADSTFAEFCGGLGYDEDSRKALAQFKACQRTAAKLRDAMGAYFDEAITLAGQL